ncbi:MAG: DeoR/GlpR transcriptional regulator [Lachnospiraceae bacterium]|nr:DeoR/GlpR transcriptional regulator [Lachnospiraceae bacterium]
MLNKRQQTILDFINEHGEARNSQLQELIGDCSSMTLWRDLEKLEADGKIVRFRGGAQAGPEREDGQGQEINFLRRARQNTGEKESIALIAADLMQPDQSFFLDAGSTTFTLLRYIHQGNYNFITSAANIASELARHPGYDVTMLGGQLNPNTLSCSGPMAERMLQEINIDIAVMASSGYSPGSAFTSGRLSEAELKKLVIRKAFFTIMLLDHSKLSKRHPFTFATLDDVDIVIGDSSLPAEFREACALHKVQLFTSDDGLSSEERKQILLSLLQAKAAS